MKTWEVYAFVRDGIVLNVCKFALGGYAEAVERAANIFGDGCEVIDVTNIRAAVFDTYHDGAFWYKDEEGTEHKREEVPSEEDRIEAVESSTADNTSSIESNTTAIDDILIMLLDDTADTDTTEAET